MRKAAIWPNNSPLQPRLLGAVTEASHESINRFPQERHSFALRKLSPFASPKNIYVFHAPISIVDMYITSKALLRLVGNYLCPIHQRLAPKESLIDTVLIVHNY